MQKDTSSFRAATILNLLLFLTASPDCPLDGTRVAATTRVALLRDAPVEGDGPIGLLSARAAAQIPLHQLQNMCSSTSETPVELRMSMQRLLVMQDCTHIRFW
jgi:hypothetical protein